MKARSLFLVAAFSLTGALVAGSASASPPNRPMADDPSLNDYAVAGPQLALGDITATPLGQQKIAEFVNEPSQYAAGCVTRGNLTLKVYNLFQAAGVPLGATEPDYLTVPSNVPVTLVRAHYDPVSGQRDLTVKLGIGQNGPLSGHCGTGGGGGAQWKKQIDLCFLRAETGRAWIDACVKLSNLEGDGSLIDDWRELEMFATAKSKGVWTLYAFYVHSVREESAAIYQWSDWSPRADLNIGNCSTQTLSVAAQGVGISSTHTGCELWDIDKQAAPGDFMNMWRGSVMHSEREVAAMHVVKVPQGGVASYTVDYNFVAG
jgi:hypothetical protein